MMIMYCTNCGAEVKGKFCSHCGNPVGEASPSTPTAIPTPNSISDSHRREHEYDENIYGHIPAGSPSTPDPFSSQETNTPYRHQTDRPYKDNTFKIGNNIHMDSKGAATASMVLGIISIVISSVSMLGVTGMLGLILGIIGLGLSSTAKKQGAVGGIVTAGMVLSLLGTIFNSLGFVSCFMCFGLW